MKKECKFKFCDKSWKLRRLPADEMSGSMGMIWSDQTNGDRTLVVLDTVSGDDFIETILHELLEEAIAFNGGRYDDMCTGSHKFIMLINHDQFDKICGQVVGAYEDIKHNIGFVDKEGRDKRAVENTKRKRK